MEAKEIKIQVPEGYEIDKKNSTFECIKFKPKKLTYDVIARELFMGKESFYSDRGEIVSSFLHSIESCVEPDNCVSVEQCKKLMALNKLINVAKYLNGDWKPTFGGRQLNYVIGILNNKIVTDYFVGACYVGPCFKTDELAKQAIEILGEETIKLALSQV